LPVRVRTPKVGTGIYDQIVSLVGQRTPRLAEVPNLAANVSLSD